jgi:hypothetical protein
MRAGKNRLAVSSDEARLSSAGESTASINLVMMVPLHPED